MSTSPPKTGRYSSADVAYDSLGDDPLGSVDKLASEYGLTRTSGTRTPQHNKEVGGAPNSYHLQPGGAGDYDGPPEKRAEFYHRLRTTYGPNLKELFYDPEGGFKDGRDIGPVGKHSDHVHVAVGHPAASPGGSGRYTWSDLADDQEDETPTPAPTTPAPQTPSFTPSVAPLGKIKIAQDEENMPPLDRRVVTPAVAPLGKIKADNTDSAPKLRETMEVSAGAPASEDDLYRAWYQARSSGDQSTQQAIGKNYLEQFPQGKYAEHVGRGQRQEQSPPQQPSIAINLADFKDSGQTPTVEEVSGRVAQSLGFTQDEAQEYARTLGRNPFYGFGTGQAHDENAAMRSLIERTDPQTGQVAIPGIHEDSLAGAQRWLQERRRGRAADTAYNAGRQELYDIAEIADDGERIRRAGEWARKHGGLDTDDRQMLKLPDPNGDESRGATTRFLHQAESTAGSMIRGAGQYFLAPLIKGTGRIAENLTGIEEGTSSLQHFGRWLGDKAAEREAIYGKGGARGELEQRAGAFIPMLFLHGPGAFAAAGAVQSYGEGKDLHQAALEGALTYIGLKGAGAMSRYMFRPNLLRGLQPFTESELRTMSNAVESGKVTAEEMAHQAEFEGARRVSEAEKYFKADETVAHGLSREDAEFLQSEIAAGRMSAQEAAQIESRIQQQSRQVAAGAAPPKLVDTGSGVNPALQAAITGVLYGTVPTLVNAAGGRPPESWRDLAEQAAMGLAFGAVEGMRGRGTPLPETSGPARYRPIEELSRGGAEGGAAPPAGSGSVPEPPQGGTPAVWNKSGVDIPVTVVGDLGVDASGKRYVRIAESETGVPVSELVGGQPPQGSSPVHTPLGQPIHPSAIEASTAAHIAAAPRPLQEQVSAFAEGKQLAIFIPKGQPLPAKTRGEFETAGLAVTQTPAGTFIHRTNLNKPGAVSRADVKKMAQEGTSQQLWSQETKRPDSETTQPDGETMSAETETKAPSSGTMTQADAVEVTPKIDVAAHEAATSPKNDLAIPTEGQKEAGNYKKAHIHVAGMDVSIENPEGSKRKPEWPTLKSHYGYIRQTEGADGEHIDVFVRPGTPEDYSGPVYVVDQVNKDGSFDEHKVMLGWEGQASAKKAYRENYTKDFKVGEIRTFQNPAEFKEWLKTADTTKPSVPSAAQYKKSTQTVKKGLGVPDALSVQRALKTTPLGEGGNALVYGLTDKYVVRVPKRGSPKIAGEFVPLPDPFEGKNFGQAVGTIGDAQVLLRQQGTPAGVPFGKGRSAPEASATYEESTKTAAEMPQSAYDQFARDLIELNAKGHQFDPSKSNNVLIDKTNGRFNIVDVNKQTGDYSNGAHEMPVVLMDNAFAYRYKGDHPEIRQWRREILEKVRRAAKNTGLKLDEKDPSYRYSVELAQEPAEPAKSEAEQLEASTKAAIAKRRATRAPKAQPTPATPKIKVGDEFLQNGRVQVVSRVTSSGVELRLAGSTKAHRAVSLEVLASQISSGEVKPLGKMEFTSLTGKPLEPTRLISEPETPKVTVKEAAIIPTRAGVVAVPIGEKSETETVGAKRARLAQQIKDSLKKRTQSLESIGWTVAETSAEAETSTARVRWNDEDKTLELNRAGVRTLAKIRGKSGLRGLALASSRARQLADKAEQFAFANAEDSTEFWNYQTLGRALLQAADSSEEMALHRAGDEETRQHELFHVAQIALERFFGYAPSEADVKALPKFFRARSFLLEKPYGHIAKNSRAIAHEISAHIAGGQEAEVGLTFDEGVEFLDGYFRLVAKTYKPDALKRFNQLNETFGRLRDAVLEEVGSKGSTTSAAGHRIPRLAERRQEGAAASPEATKGEAAEQAESVVKQTETPEFKKWFGNSKVVDEKGEPLVVYHGTQADWEAYAPDLHSPTMAGLDHPKMGIYLTDSVEHARFYGEDRRDSSNQAHTKALYAKVENPMVEDAIGEAWLFYQEVRPDEEATEAGFQDFVLSSGGAFGVLTDAQDYNLDHYFHDLTATAKARGHDGLIMDFGNMPMTDENPDRPMGKIVIVFEPTQIKSATGNRGTFDPESPNIFESIAPLPAEVVSALEEIARTFVDEGKDNFDDLVGEFEELLGEEAFDEVADYLPQIVASQAKSARMPKEQANVEQPESTGAELSAPEVRGTGATIPERLGQPSEASLEGEPSTSVQGTPAGEGAPRSSGDSSGVSEGSIQPTGGAGERPAGSEGAGATGVHNAPGRVRAPRAKPGGGRRQRSLSKPVSQQLVDNAGSEAERRDDQTRAKTPSLTSDFMATSPEQIGAGGMKTKYKNNILAIQTLRQIEQEGRTVATAAEQEILARFVGWGMFPQLFKTFGTREDPDLRAISGDVPYDQYRQAEAAKKEEKEKWQAEAEEFRALMSDDEYDSAHRSILNAHYTHPRVVQGMWGMAQRMGFKGGRVLEPALGVGNFFAMMPPELRGNSKLTGVELDLVTGGMARLLYPHSNIQVKGYQDLKVPDGFYDLVISNVPFGNYHVYDRDYEKIAPRSSIHDYYFLKSVDKTRPGGLVLFITSAHTMDKGDSRIRELINRKADLVQAFRLPDGAFEKNAGTAVVTDVLILQRRAEGQQPAGSGWMGLGSVPDPDGGDSIPINEYYVANPQNVLGTVDRKSRMYGRGDAHVSAPPDLWDRLQKVLADTPEGVYRPAARKTISTFEPQRLEAPGELKDGNLTVKDGKIWQKEGEHLVEQKPPSKMPTEKPENYKARLRDLAERISNMSATRDAVRLVFNTQIKGASEVERKAARVALNNSYDDFVKKHGYLSEAKNVRLFAEDPDSPTLLALEDWNPKTKKAKKRAIFSQDVITHASVPDKATDVPHALLISLAESGGVDLERMAGLLGVPAENLTAELVEKGLAYNDPKVGWVPAAEYLSGNVRRKLYEARESALADAQFQPNVDALEKVQPEDISYDQIYVRLGAPWLDKNDVRDFAAHLMSGKATDFTIGYIETSGQWLVHYTQEGKERHAKSSASLQLYGTAEAPFLTVLQNALDGRLVRVMGGLDEKGQSVGYMTEKGEWIPSYNKYQSDLANGKVTEIREKFQNWLWTDDERRARLHRYYNDTFNNVRVAVFDGSHLTIDSEKSVLRGMNPGIHLRPHQVDGVWRMVATGRVLYNHEVGTGKTYTMIAAAMELRRMGLAKKPAISAPKAVVADISDAARNLYPGIKLISIEGKFSQKDRRRTISQVATGDYDLVILTHDNLNQLPMGGENEARFIQEELDELDTVLNAAEEADGGAAAGERYSRRSKKQQESRLVKQLRKQRERLEAKLLKAVDRVNRDTNVTFEETGIDALFVDEAHMYKSLPIYTRLERIKGIPTNYSQRAANMLMRTRWLIEQNGGRGVAFATGTPVANTIAELFNVQRYLQWKELQERGIQSFDAWAKNYTIESTKMTMHFTGDYAPETRLDEFINVPDLQQLTQQVIDTKQAEDLPQISRPLRHDEAFTVPMSRQQRAYMMTLRARMEAIKARKGPPEKGDDIPLVVNTDARKMSVDIRLVLPDGKDYPDSKVNRLVAEVMAKRKAFPGSTQLVFSDIGVRANAWGFRLYDDIVAKLVKAGIPQDKIIDFAKFPNTDAGKAAKASGQERLRTGDAIIGIGSTQKLGTGVNVQDKLIAVHHLDSQYVPANVEQRNGRVWRQGNQHTKISIHPYVTAGSIDARLWSIVGRKTQMIKQFLKGDATARTFKAEAGDELSPETIAAIASGNPLLVEKIELEEQLRNLEAGEKRHAGQQYAYRDTAAKLQRELRRGEDQLRISQADKETYDRHAGEPFRLTVKKTVLSNPGTYYESKQVQEVVETEPEQAMRSLQSALEVASKAFDREYADVEVGEYKGFAIFRQAGKDGTKILRGEDDYRFNFAWKDVSALDEQGEQIVVQKHSKMSQADWKRMEGDPTRTTYDGGETRTIDQLTETRRQKDGGSWTVFYTYPEKKTKTVLDAEGSLQRLEGALNGWNGIGDRLRKAQSFIETESVGVKEIEKEIGKPFKDQAALIALRERVDDLTRRVVAGEGQDGAEESGSVYVGDKVRYANETWVVMSTSTYPSAIGMTSGNTHQWNSQEEFEIQTGRRLGEGEEDGPIALHSLDDTAIEEGIVLGEGDEGEDTEESTVVNESGSARKATREGLAKRKQAEKDSTAGVGFGLGAAGLGNAPPPPAPAPPPSGGPFEPENPETAARWKAARGIPPPSPWIAVRETLTKLKHLATRDLEHLPRTSANAELHFALKRLEQGKGIASDEAVRILQGLTSGLSKEDYELFTYRVIYDDLLEEVQHQGARSEEDEADIRLPFGYTAESLQRDSERLDTALSDHRAVRDAVQARGQLVREVTGEYLQSAKTAIGFEPKLTRQQYYRHQVLAFAEAERRVKGTGQKIKAPVGRGFLKRRHGSELDINTDYLQAEHSVLAQMLYDTQAFKLIHLVDQNHNSAVELARQVKHVNAGAIQAIIDQEEIDNGTFGSQGPPSGPVGHQMREYRVAIGRGFAELRAAALDGHLWVGDNDQWADAVASLQQTRNVDQDFNESNSLFKYLSALAATEETGSLQARMILKAVANRRVFVRQTLGPEFQTIEDVVPEGHRAWQPREGTIVFHQYTLPERLVDQALTDRLAEIGFNADDLRAAMVMGGKRREFILPDEVADTLDHFMKQKDRNVVDQMVKAPVRYWKAWQLLSPHRAFKYNFRNISGDAEAAFLGNPRAFLQVPKATGDLYDYLRREGAPTPELQEWLERGGLHNLFQVAEDVGQVSGLKLFRNLRLDNESKLQEFADTLNPWRQYWRAARMTTDFREAILRYAAFIDYRRQMMASGGRPANYGASLREEIQAMRSIPDKAYKLSNDLLGAYDEVSELGQWLRSHLFPFWSWQEVNAKRYWRLLRNAAQDGRSASDAAHNVLGRSVKMSPLMAWRIGKFLLKMSALWVILQVYNNEVWPDEERDLDERVRARIHIILGRNTDGSVRYFDRLGTLGDILSWVGADEAPHYVSQFLNNKKTLREIAFQMLVKEPTNKLVQATGLPLTLGQMATGRSLYPDVWRSKNIRDRWQFLFNQFALGDEYGAIAGKPARPLGKTIRNIFFYEVDPDESAYNTILSLKSDYNVQHGKPADVSSGNDKANAAYYMKLALRIGDTEAAQRYLAEYASLGGTPAGLQESIKLLAPLAGLNDQEKAEFLKTLTADETARLTKAQRFFDSVLDKSEDVGPAGLLTKPIPKELRVPVDKELQRFGIGFPYPQNEITIQDKKTELPKDQFEAFQQRLAEDAYRELNKLIASPGYQALPEIRKKDAIETFKRDWSSVEHDRLHAEIVTDSDAKSRLKYEAGRKLRGAEKRQRELEDTDRFLYKRDERDRQLNPPD